MRVVCCWLPLSGFCEQSVFGEQGLHCFSSTMGVIFFGCQAYCLCQHLGQGWKSDVASGCCQELIFCFPFLFRTVATSLIARSELLASVMLSQSHDSIMTKRLITNTPCHSCCRVEVTARLTDTDVCAAPDSSGNTAGGRADAQPCIMHDTGNNLTEVSFKATSRQFGAARSQRDRPI